MPARVAWLVVGLLLVPSAGAGRATAPTLEQLVGQRLVVAMTGTEPSASLLARIRAGEVGGVILFGANVRSAPQVRALTRALRGAAAAGGRPRLLVAVDQEGGAFRRLRWAPPSLPAAQLGNRSEAELERIGAATGHALKAAGVDVDLAPVADVPRVAGSFVAAQERAFATRPVRAGNKAAAFARGLAGVGVAATAKHFPGLGRAKESTDVTAVTIRATRAQLDADLVPFRRLIAERVPLVMLSNAVYAALGAEPAFRSPATHRLLRRDLGFTGVTITDALEASASAEGRPLGSVAILAARVGTDLLLVTGGERSSAGVFSELVAAARAGRLQRASLERSYGRVLALKRRLSAPA